MATRRADLSGLGAQHQCSRREEELARLGESHASSSLHACLDFWMSGWSGVRGPYDPFSHAIVTPSSALRGLADNKEMVL
jgi:hypothetical protein